MSRESGPQIQGASLRKQKERERLRKLELTRVRSCATVTGRGRGRPRKTDAERAEKAVLVAIAKRALAEEGRSGVAPRCRPEAARRVAVALRASLRDCSLASFARDTGGASRCVRRVPDGDVQQEGSTAGGCAHGRGWVAR